MSKECRTEFEDSRRGTATIRFLGTVQFIRLLHMATWEHKSEARAPRRSGLRLYFDDGLRTQVRRFNSNTLHDGQISFIIARKLYSLLRLAAKSIVRSGTLRRTASKLKAAYALLLLTLGSASALQMYRRYC